MKHFGWMLLAGSSLVFATLVAGAETRPQYGGTLHLSMHETPTSLDPTDTAQPDSLAWRNLTSMMFETLVTVDDHGHISPGLATFWLLSANGRAGACQLRLRKEVMFHDGTALTSALVAKSLQAANPSWKINAEADSVTIEMDPSHSVDVIRQLALTRNSIVKKMDDGRLIGTGPFHVAEWAAGKKLVLGAEETYWGGRPFLDAIEINFGQGFHEQLITLESGRAALIEIPAEQLHRMATAGRRLLSSEPIQLVALVFARAANSPEEKSLREALALSIDRASIGNVILQGAGSPAFSILPNWMSGYSFAFSQATDLMLARRLREGVRTITPWTISYDASDSIDGLVAGRIALNARDAGLQLQPTKALTADVRLVRISLSAESSTTLKAVATLAGLPPPNFNGDSIEGLYAAERALLGTQRLIPLFHLPVIYAASTELQGWKLRPDGLWNAADSWLSRKSGSVTH
ncbi:MAG TPA: ABC transporter substrate-binding protein [Candidatus Sulfotelmatobacter sp.]